MSLLWVYVSILSVFNSCVGENVRLHAFSPGDIVIGGLFRVHQKSTRDEATGKIICSSFDFHRFLASQVMIHAIREINRQRILPNITIGYEIYDTCGHVSLAIRATLRLLRSWSDPQKGLLSVKTEYSLDEPGIMAVIGESSSEVSANVARVLAVSSVAQISYASTSELLSQKDKFPTFLRTVSSDAHQTKGIVKLMRKFNWKTVAIVGSEDAYGKYGSDRLNDDSISNDICVEFVEILPGYFSQNKTETRRLLDNLVGQISKSSAEAIIMFTMATNVEIIMEAAIKSKLNRTWVAGDSWSTSVKISTLPNIQLAGQVFGFTFIREEVPGFKDFVLSNSKGAHDATRDNYTSQFLVCGEQREENSGGYCNLTSPLTNSLDGSRQCVDRRCIMDFINKNSSYSLYLAVQVVADSLRRMMKCDNQKCNRTSNFKAIELFKEIQKTNCTLSNTHIFFDKDGNPSLGYDIVYWNTSNTQRKVQVETIGKYWPGGEITVPDNLEAVMNTVQVTVYGCFKTCKPGYELEIQDKPCCAYCVPCAQGEFSSGNGSQCQQCREEEYSDEQRDMCHPTTDEFFKWSSPFSIALNCFAVLGIIVTSLFGVLFMIYRDTPIVKAVGGNLVFLELLSLVACFAVTFSFSGKPNLNTCRISLPLFGFASSLCISCILANLLQILVGFDFHMKVSSWVKKLNRPVPMVTVVSGVQLALSVSWLIFEPSVPQVTESQKTHLHMCTLHSIEFFAVTIAYNALLALICFLFAFKGKDLPDLYKNAILISVSMLLFLIIWLIFFPLFLTLMGKTHAGLKSASILIFTYSILCCHLAPKCYIMVFRKNLNNESAITEYIKKHYVRQGKEVVKS